MAGERTRSDEYERTGGSTVRPAGESSLGELFTALTTDMTTLVRKEVELARTETVEKISKATRSVVYMVAGGMLAYAGLIGLIIAAIVALSNVMELWLAALIVGLVVIIIGAILLQSGRSMLQRLSIVPEKTVESIKESTEWAKEQVQ
jgi:hypothetical protein